MLAVFLLLIGILSRFIFHVPNFTPVLALALFGGFCLRPRLALLMPLGLMIFSDLLLGGHDTMVFTWGSVVLISALGISQRRKFSFGNVIGMSLLSSGIFFIVTNFGCWLVMYPMTLAGLRDCFWMAIPFFRSTILSTLVYSAVFFYAYKVLANYAAKTRFAKILLE